MSAGSPAAGDVPGLFDCLLNGQGYVFLRTVDTSLPFRTQRARYSRTPTFIDRSNVSGAYGDNEQDFFLTVSQNDWSGGEQQRFFRSTDQDSRSRYYLGASVDIRAEGQVSLRKSNRALTFAAAAKSCSPRGVGSSPDVIVATTTNLYQVDSAGTITDKSAHGLGVAPGRFAVATDGVKMYVSSTAGGSVGIRKWDGASYTTWSASPADSLEFLNNTLYGTRSNGSNCDLVSYSTAGVGTVVFTWQQIDGGVQSYSIGRLKAYGGKLLILWSYGAHSPELWQYDGTNTSMVATFPADFFAYDLQVVNGVAYVSGCYQATNGIVRPAIFYYTADTIGLLWQATGYMAATGGVSAVINSMPALAAFNAGLVFNDDTTGNFMFYDPATGGIHAIGAYTVAGDTPLFASGLAFFLHTRNQTGGYSHPSDITATSGSVTTSLFDFNNSLTKQMRGVKVDFVSGSDGNGGSVDIAYRVGDLDGSYTTLQTGATSGTEYMFSGVSGRSISIKVTLNKGTSTSGPVLKRVYVRAAPILQSYRRDEFIHDLSGRKGKASLVLNNAQPHPLDGVTQAANLLTAIQATSPFTVVTRHGSYTGVIEPGQTDLIEVRPEEYIARVVVREV